MGNHNASSNVTSMDESTDSVHTDAEDNEDEPQLPYYERVELRHYDEKVVRPLILLGPTKDSISDQLLLDYPETFSACVPHTTRSPRAGEQDGVFGTKVGGGGRGRDGDCCFDDCAARSGLTARKSSPRFTPQALTTTLSRSSK